MDQLLHIATATIATIPKVELATATIATIPPRVDTLLTIVMDLDYAKGAQNKTPNGLGRGVTFIPSLNETLMSSSK